LTKVPSTNFQAPEKLQNSKLQTTASVVVWSLKFFWSLLLGIWNFSIVAPVEFLGIIGTVLERRRIASGVSRGRKVRTP
jgi:hypothetical protein